MHFCFEVVTYLGAKEQLHRRWHRVEDLRLFVHHPRLVDQTKIVQSLGGLLLRNALLSHPHLCRFELLVDLRFFPAHADHHAGKYTGDGTVDDDHHNVCQQSESALRQRAVLRVKAPEDIPLR